MVYNIRGYHGGMGDQLQFSNLPELLSKAGHTVNLYTGPEVLPFRNNDIKELWLRNPFISGTSDKDWNLGDIPGKPYINTQGSFIKNWEVIFGLPPTNELPIIYHTCSPVPLQKPFGLIELSSKTLSYNNDLVVRAVKNITNDYSIPFYVMVSNYQHETIILPNSTPINVTGLFHAADLINACDVFISLNSGLHSLGAAIQRNHKFNQYCLLPSKDYDWIMSDKKFIFAGINYIKT